MRSRLLSHATLAHIRYVVRVRRLRGARQCARCGWPNARTRQRLGDVAIVGALSYTRRGARCYECRTSHSTERHHILGRRAAALTIISANVHRALHFLSGWARFSPTLATKAAYLIGESSP